MISDPPQHFITAVIARSPSAHLHTHRQRVGRWNEWYVCSGLEGWRWAALSIFTSALVAFAIVIAIVAVSYETRKKCGTSGEDVCYIYMYFLRVELHYS